MTAVRTWAECQITLVGVAIEAQRSVVDHVVHGGTAADVSAVPVCAAPPAWSCADGNAMNSTALGGQLVMRCRFAVA